MAAKSELEFQGMLLSTGLVQPIRVVSETGRLSALCRLVPGREVEWLKVVEQLLQAATVHSLTLHVCKQFVLKNGQMVAGWYVAIEDKSVRRQKTALEVLGPVLAAVIPELGSEPTVRFPAGSTVLQGPIEVTTGVKVMGQPIPPDEEEDLEEAEQVPQTADIIARRLAYQAKTSAAPRTPAPAPNIELPVLDQTAAAKRTVQRGMTVDSKGRPRQVVIEEMPLPGIFTDDMNKPSEKGRGANKLG